MPQDKIKKILDRFNQAKKRKELWTELYEEVLEYTSPHRETFHSDFDTPGQRKLGEGQVFDSTAQDAHQKFASNLQSSLTPPMKDWMVLKPGSQVQDEPGLEETLQNITKILFSHIHNSNFNTQVSEGFLDLGVGTGALLFLKGTPAKPFNFVNVPLSQLYLEEGPNGIVETAFRCSRIHIRNILKTWEDAELSKEMKEKVEQDPNAETKLLEATISEKIEFLNPQTNEKEIVDGFRYIIIDIETKSIIVERAQRSSPWVIFRWSTIPGEIYGRGPLIFALPDIRTLNKTKELLLNSASISVVGMYTVEDDGIINPENIELGPGAMIPVDSNGRNGRGASLQPLSPPGDPQLAQIVIDDLKTNINSMLFADPLGPVDLPVKSATEVSLRQQDLAKRIGSAFGRLQFELITPLVNRALDILDDLGLIDLGPFRIDGNIIAIEHVSPLAMAQEEEEFVSMLRMAETLAGLYGPEMLNALMPADRFVKLSRRRLNLPSEVMATDEEIETMKQLVAQQAAAEIPATGE